MVLLVALWLWLRSPTSADTIIFHGGDIVTMDDRTPEPEAVLVENGAIKRVGLLTELQAAAPNAELHNLGGKTLMPGFIEPHTHPIAAALFAATIDVSGFTHDTRADVMETLRREIGNSPGAWAIAFGWDPVMLDDLDAPTLAELDALSPEKPLLILTQMMHDAYLNSAALAAAGITDASPNPPAGEFVKDAEGKLTGTIREVGALNAVFAKMPKTPAGTNDLLVNVFLSEYAKAGYTTIGVLGPVGNDANPIDLLKRVTKGPTALVQALIYALPTQLGSANRPETHDDETPVIGVKFWMDGSPYAGGAAVREPYETNSLTKDRLHLPAGHSGNLMIPEDSFEAMFRDYHTRGFQIATHVQGERAVERVLAVAEKVLAEHPKQDHRHRLEHNALITEEQLLKAKHLGFTTSFFIDHVRFYGDKLPALFGTERTNRYMPIGTALATGHTVSFHGDHPATPIGPMRSIVTAISRIPNNGNDALGPDQKLSRYEALKAITTSPAWQLGIESTRGSISPGKQADLVILSDNPLTAPLEQLEDIKAQSTWIKGRRIDTRETTMTNAKLALTLIYNYLF